MYLEVRNPKRTLVLQVQFLFSPCNVNCSLFQCIQKCRTAREVWFSKFSSCSLLELDISSSCSCHCDSHHLHFLKEVSVCVLFIILGLQGASCPSLTFNYMLCILFVDFEIFSIQVRCPRNLGSIGLAVFMCIGYKQTNKQSMSPDIFAYLKIINVL